MKSYFVNIMQTHRKQLDHDKKMGTL